jgi:hypothetical protein
LVAFCLSHFLADFIICMCVFDFRQAQASSGSDRMGNAGGDGVESIYRQKG